jgi:hypothetical protein
MVLTLCAGRGPPGRPRRYSARASWDWPGYGSVPAVLLLPEVICLLLGLEPGLITVQVTEASAVEVLVNLRRGKAGQQFLAERVVLGDAFPLAVMLVHAHGLKAGRARQQVVRDLVVWYPAAVHLVVGALGAAPVKESHGSRT